MHVFDCGIKYDGSPDPLDVIIHDGSRKTTSLLGVVAGTMTGSSWDSFLQGTVYNTLPRALGCVRFAALTTQWVKAYKEVHTF